MHRLAAAALLAWVLAVGLRHLALEFSLRLERGGIDKVADPGAISPGILVAYHLDHRPGSRGWRIGVEARHAWNNRLGTPQWAETTMLGFNLSWLP